MVHKDNFHGSENQIFRFIFQRWFCWRHDIFDFSSNGLTKLSPIRRFDNQALSVEIASEGCLGLVCDRPSLIRLFVAAWPSWQGFRPTFDRDAIRSHNIWLLTWIQWANSVSVESFIARDFGLLLLRRSMFCWSFILVCHQGHAKLSHYDRV